MHAMKHACMHSGPCHFLGRRVHGFTILHACRPHAAGEGQQMMDVSSFDVTDAVVSTISGKLGRKIRGGGLPAMLGILWQRCFEPSAVFEWPG